MFNFAAKFETGLTYSAFLETYGSADQRSRWDAVHRQVQLTASQKQLLGSFTREMKLLVLAGAWCGDCVNQCPIFDHIAAAAPQIQFRYFDRDASADLAEAISICGGHRVPTVVFVSEDGYFCGIYGDRTLARYRQMAATQLGPACPTGIGSTDIPMLQQVTAEWLNEIERVQLMLRLSGRLRQLHGD